MPFSIKTLPLLAQNAKVGESVEYYEAISNAAYTANLTQFNTAAASNDGETYYFMQFPLEAAVSMYEATGNTVHLDRFFAWAETMVSKSLILPVDVNNQRNWGGDWTPNPYTPSSIAFSLQDTQATTAFSRACRIIFSNTSLSSYNTRAVALYNFVRDHIVNKNAITRGEYAGFATSSTNPAGLMLDKITILCRHLLNLHYCSILQGNADTNTYGWYSKLLVLCRGMRDYGTTTLNRFGYYQGGLIWDQGKEFDAGSTTDTDHSNRVPFFMLEMIKERLFFDMNYFMGIGDLFCKVIWDANYPLSSPRIKNHIDGGNGFFRTRPAWNNGKIYDGWVILSQFHDGVFIICDAILKAMLNGVSNPTLDFNNTFYGQYTLPSHLCWTSSVRSSKGKTFANNPVSPNIFQKRYIFYRTGSGGLATTSDKDRLVAIMTRGAAVGYNGVVLQDAIMRSSSPSAQWTTNFNALVASAASLDMEIIYMSFTMGEPDNTASIELREAFPVTNTKFVRSGSTAFAQGDPAPVLLNGNFEAWTGNSPNSWTVDGPGVIAFRDTTIKHGGTSSLRFTNPTDNNPSNNARCYQAVNVTTFRAYRLTAYIKTQSFTVPTLIRFVVIGVNNGRTLYGNRDLSLGSGEIGGTQDWTFFRADFNSLDCTQVYIYINASSSSTGSVWFDDVTLTEVGLASMVRRASTPIVVKAYAGSPTYTEGSDYVVGSEQLSFPGGSTIPAGASLKVSWYQLAATSESFNIQCNSYHSEFYAEFTTNAGIAYGKHPFKGWLVNFDELRTTNWDPAAGSITAGAYMANTMTLTEDVIQAVNPNIEIMVWNDMFDPYHNAIAQYYQSNGNFAGGWNGISSTTLIVNWYYGPGVGNPSNMKFWYGIDPAYPKVSHRQIIAGYYESTTQITNWINVLNQAEAQGVRNVIGYMYTTYANDSAGKIGRYDDLEAVAQMWTNAGRWSSLPAFP